MNPVNTTPYHLPEDAVWLITGCSTGIGRELAKLVASKPKQRLIATARNTASLDYLPTSPQIVKVALDVTSVASVDAAFAAAAQAFNRLDVVVNNAGYSLSGDSEAAPEDQTHRIMETNFFGTARVMSRAVGVMRQAPGLPGGLILNISSVAGVCTFPGHAYYHASKYAVNGLSESIARELHPDWKINVCIVEPAGVHTDFHGRSEDHIAPNPAYADPELPTRKLQAYVKKGLASSSLINPARLAETLYSIASRGENVPLHLPIGKVAYGIMKTKFEKQLQDLEATKEITVAHG